MSVRYSGDTEIRIKYDERRGTYVGSVTDPFLRFRIAVANPGKTSKERDQAARRLLMRAMRWARGQKRQFLVDGSGSKIKIRRVYQAPCPLE